MSTTGTEKKNVEFEELDEEAVRAIKKVKQKRLLRKAGKWFLLGIAGGGLFLLGSRKGFKKGFCTGAGVTSLAHRVPDGKKETVSNLVGYNLKKMKEICDNHQETLSNEGHSDWFTE